MRRYEPCIVIESDYTMEGWVDHSSVQMKESKGGEWVPYENAHHEIKRLNKRIAKLEKLLTEAKNVQPS